MHRLTSTAALLCVFSLAGHGRAAEPARVTWDPAWPRVSLAEKIGLIPLFLTTLSFALIAPPSDPHWRGGILFDERARHALRGRTLSVQRTTDEVGSYIYIGSMPALLIVDVGIVTVGVHRSPDVAGQMLLMDLQAFGMSGAVTLGTEHLSGRERPYVQDCGPDGRVRNAAGDPLHNSCSVRTDNESFFAGHVTVVSTTAGLTCAHHQHLPLYGAKWADVGACALTVGAAGFVGVSRIVADKHWASDVLVGMGVGALSGYVVPSLLHYGFGGRRAPEAGRVAPVRVLAAPVAFPGGIGVSVAGSF